MGLLAEIFFIQISQKSFDKCYLNLRFYVYFTIEMLRDQMPKICGKTQQFLKPVDLTSLHDAME